jgi:hypothetical protein
MGRCNPCLHRSLDRALATWRLVLDKSILYKVLLVNREVNLADENKQWTIAAWSVLGGTLTLAVCYYAFRYDSAGTYKPLSTDSLG